MEIRRIPISEINPAPYNPRKDLKPGDPEYEKLKRSLEEFDLVEPLVWNEVTGNLVGGHQRLKILIERGDKEVDVSVVRLDPTREKALNLALNKIQGDWDLEKLKDLLLELDTGEIDMEITGFDDAEIEQLMTQFHVEDEQSAGEDFDVVKALEEIVEARIKPGEVWQLGRHRICCGDSTDPAVWDRVLGGQKLDLVVTSPPYNVGVEYASYRDKRARDEYLGFIRTVGVNIVKRLRPGRFVAWNVGVSPETYPHYQVVTLEACGLEFYRQIVWEKVGVPYPIFQYTLKARQARHYTPNYKHEVIYVMKADGETHLPEVECPVCEGTGIVEGMVNTQTHAILILLTTGEAEDGGKIRPLRKYAHDVWHIPQHQATVDLPTLGAKSLGLTKQGKPGHVLKAHPAAFPVELPRVIMAFLTAEEEAVMDPFVGAGATIIACEEANRIGFGIEIDPIYCELTMQRWEKLTGEKAVRAHV